MSVVIFEAVAAIFSFIWDLPQAAVQAWSQHRPQVLVTAGYAVAGVVGYKSLPQIAHRYVLKRRDEAAREGEVKTAELEAARIIATGDVALDPHKLVAAISAARIDRDWGVWVSFICGEHTDAVISGRYIEPLLSAVLAEYPEAQLQWIDDPREAYAVPDLPPVVDPAGEGQGAGFSANGGGEALRDVYRVYELAGESAVGTESIETQCKRVGKGEDPISGAVVAIEDAIDPASGEWAEVALHLRPAPKSSANRLKAEALDYREELETAEGGGAKLARGLFGGIVYVVVSKFAGMRVMMGGKGSKGDRYRETDQSKEVKGRAKSRRHLLVRPVGRGRVRPGREEGLERAFDSYFSRCGKEDGAEITPKRRPGAYEKRPLTELKLAGPRPGARDADAVITPSEAAALWHPVGAGAHTRRQRVSYLKTIAPSPRLPKTGPFLARTNHPGSDMALRFDMNVLPSHVRFLGVPGTGKSTLQFQAAEAILGSPGLKHGKMGMVLLDPKYSLYRAVLENFPESRDDDVIVLNAGSETPMPGYNLLVPEPGLDAEAVADSLVEILESRWPKGFGDRMRPLMVRSIKTLVYANVEAMRNGEEPQYNLSHLSRTKFLSLCQEDGVSPEFRARVLGRLYDREEEFGDEGGPYRELLDEWEEFEYLGAKTQEERTQPITNKIEALFSSQSARRLFGVNHKDFTLKEVLEDGRIVLFNLSKHVYRGNTGYIVGTIFLSLLLQAAITRYGEAAERGEEGELRECVVFIDEVQNFLCTQMVDIINEGRAYKIPMVLAHQETSQVGSDTLKEAMEACKTKAYFTTTLADGYPAAKRIENGFTAELLNKMPDYNFVYTSMGGLVVTASTVPIPKNLIGRDVALDVADWSSERWASQDKHPTPMPDGDASLIDSEDSEGPEPGEESFRKFGDRDGVIGREDADSGDDQVERGPAGEQARQRAREQFEPESGAADAQAEEDLARLEAMWEGATYEELEGLSRQDGGSQEATGTTDETPEGDEETGEDDEQGEGSDDERWPPDDDNRHRFM